MPVAIKALLSISFPPGFLQVELFLVTTEFLTEQCFAPDSRLVLQDFSSVMVNLQAPFAVEELLPRRLSI